MAANRDHSAGDIERDKAKNASGLEDDKHVDTGDSKAPTATSMNSAEHDKKTETDKSQDEAIEQSDSAGGQENKQDVVSTDKRDETSDQASIADKEAKAAEDSKDMVGDSKVDGQAKMDHHAHTAAQNDDVTGSDHASNPFYPWERKMDTEKNWPFWYNVETTEAQWVQADANGNPLPIPSGSDYDPSSSANAHNGEYGNSYGYHYNDSYGAQHGNAYNSQYGSTYTTDAYAAAGYAAPSTHTHSSPSQPKRLYGGYNPAIHGSYDPNADYAKEAEREEEEAEAARRAADLAAAGVPPPGASISIQAHFNQVHGRFQDASMNPELHNDENKSHRQMNAFFDVNTAANQHDGRSLKEERRNQKISKKELQFYKKRDAERRAEKLRKFWME